MKKHKIKYTDEPIGKLQVIPDFLPSPEDLVLKAETAKITLPLTRKLGRGDSRTACTCEPPVPEDCQNYFASIPKNV